MAFEILSIKLFHNHLKLQLAFQFARNVLEQFVHEDTDEFIESVLHDIYTTSSVPKGTKCYSCRTPNVLECPTTELCYQKYPKKCVFHNGSCNTYRCCPNGICTKFKDKIKAMHIGQPVWQNTDATKWCRCATEVAKCFMPKKGYEDKTSLKDIDFNGIINVIINSKRCRNKLSIILTKRGICEEIRNRCNQFRHSPTLAIEDTVLEENIDLLVQLLEDPKYLHSISSSAVTNLRQLKTNTFEINSTQISRVLTEEIRVREEEALMEISDRSNEAMEDLSDYQKQQMVCLKAVRDSLCEDVKEITATTLAEMIDKQVSAIAGMTECARKQKSTIEKTSSREQRKLQRTANKLKNVLESRGQKDKGQHRVEETDINEHRSFKEELRDHMIEYYKVEYKHLQVSPVIDTNKANLLEFYVNPAMYCVDVDRQPFRNEESRFTNPCTSYKKIFRKGDDKCKDIYITSPTGGGKTCCVKVMALTWCQAWKREDSKQAYFEKENIDAMNEFSFLFLISLRHCRSKECDVDEMIRNQLLCKLPQKFQAEDRLEKLLQSEKCLIIIDGLDEWSHPTKRQKKCQEFSSKIPHRKFRLRTTVLATTRRWKYHIVSRENVPIDQHIEIMGLDKESADMLIKKVVSHLNFRSGQSKTPDEFNNLLETKGLLKFVQFPLILMQFLCLWYDGKDPGESKCQIFSNMLELLFTYACKRTDFADKYKNIQEHSKKGKWVNKMLPPCFKTAPLCSKYRKLLFSLAKLSYEILFGENYDNSLVFDQKVVDIYLSEDEFSLCVETGILLQSKQTGKLTSDEVTFSFLHKTFQELLAALHISSKSNLPTNMMPKIVKKITSVDEILRMEMFLTFLSGLSPKVITDLSEVFVSVIEKDDMTARYRRNIGTIFIKDVKKMQELSDLMTTCVEESRSNGLDCSVYLDDIFVDERCSDCAFRAAMSNIIDKNKHRAKSLYINIHQTVPDDIVKTIMKETNAASLASLEKLFVWGSIGQAHIESLLANSKASLKCLELWNQELFPEYLDIMHRINSVHGLSLMSIYLPHDQIDNLMSCISRNKALKQLHLNGIMCSDHVNECRGYRLSLNTDAEPQMLVLDKVHVTGVFLNASRIQTCIVELLYKPGALDSLLKCLEDAPNLKRLECDSPIGDKDTEVLISTVTKFVNLNYLRLRNVSISSRKLDLTNMKDLMRVHIWHSSMTASVFKGIVDDVKLLGTSRSVMVIFDSCTILPQEEANDVIDYVKASSNFDVLSQTNKKYPHFHFKTKEQQQQQKR